MAAPINLGYPEFPNHPHILIRPLITAAINALSAGNRADIDLTQAALSTLDWRAANPTLGNIPRLFPAYIPITANMTPAESKAAEATNELHIHCHDIIEAIKLAIGIIIAADIMDNFEIGFRLESLGDIMDKLKARYNRPSDALLAHTATNLTLWNFAVPYTTNISVFKRALAFLNAHDTLTCRGDQIRAFQILLANAGFPFTEILLDFKKLHPNNDWANTATGHSLTTLYRHVDDNVGIFALNAATSGNSGYSSFGMGHALGIPPPTHMQGQLSSTAAPHVPAGTLRQYCFFHGYNAGHVGVNCANLLDRMSTAEMRTARIHRALESPDGTIRQGSEENIESQTWF